jgi:hypothetical protein
MRQGPRVVVSIEGTRSFGVGLARAVAAPGLTVIKCEQPNHKAPRREGSPASPYTPAPQLWAGATEAVRGVRWPLVTRS